MPSKLLILLTVVAGTGLGRADPKPARSQIIGTMAMGVGAALMEELAVDKRAGLLVNHDLASYEVNWRMA